MKGLRRSATLWLKNRIRWFAATLGHVWREAQRNGWVQWTLGRYPRLRILEHDRRHTLYELEYWIEDRRFVMRLCPPRGPQPFERIEQILPFSDEIHVECRQDMMDRVMPYLGPHGDFHGGAYRLRPIDLGMCGPLIFKRYGQPPVQIQPLESFAQMCPTIE